jgi:hypothetical protein
MYNVSDAVEMGDARELVQSILKVEFVEDDIEDRTAEPEEYFDE